MQGLVEPGMLTLSLKSRREHDVVTVVITHAAEKGRLWRWQW